MAMAVPAAVACTAPQAPSARPLSPSRASAIAAVSVPTTNKPLPKPIRTVPIRHSVGDSMGAEKITAEKASEAGQDAQCRQPVGIGAPAQLPCGQGEAGQRAAGQQGRQRRGLADGQVQDLAAIGFQQDVLHAEGRRAQPDRDQHPPGASGAAERRPGLAEGRARQVGPGGGGVAGLLLPQGDHVQDHGRDGASLDQLDQAQLA